MEKGTPSTPEIKFECGIFVIIFLKNIDITVSGEGGNVNPSKKLDE